MSFCKQIKAKYNPSVSGNCFDHIMGYYWWVGNFNFNSKIFYETEKLSFECRERKLNRFLLKKENHNK